jgi:hypothetical protein
MIIPAFGRTLLVLRRIGVRPFGLVLLVLLYFFFEPVRRIGGKCVARLLARDAFTSQDQERYLSIHVTLAYKMCEKDCRLEMRPAASQTSALASTERYVRRTLPNFFFCVGPEFLFPSLSSEQRPRPR